MKTKDVFMLLEDNMKDSKIRYGVYAFFIWNCIIAINIILRSKFVDEPLDLSSVGIKLFLCFGH